MLFMVIERFRDGNPDRIGQRFRERGRMMPDDVEYVSSWLDERGTKCFQLMKAPSQESLKPWLEHWEDLVEFEVLPVLTSKQFWPTPMPETP